MTIERWRNCCDRVPFQPFILHLADGRQIPVRHKEFIFNVPAGRTIIVAQPDGNFNIIDLLLVTDIEMATNPLEGGPQRPPEPALTY